MTQNADTVVPTWQRVTQYVVSAVPEGLCMDGYAWDVTVEWRSEGLWAVKHHSYCADANGDWDYEPSPSNRTDEWKATHRFPLEEALRLAHKAAPKVCINGYYPADLIAKYAQSDGTGG